MQTESATENYLVRPGDKDDIVRLETLWLEFYEDQKRLGMRLEIPTDAFRHWADSYAPILGRFGCLFVIEKDNELIGFLTGRIRSLPPHFGGSQAGFITDVYVAEPHRAHGLGRKLVLFATNWFKELGLQRIELQVVSGNTPALNFYRRLGWSEELVQMVWEPAPTDEHNQPGNHTE